MWPQILNNPYKFQPASFVHFWFWFRHNPIGKVFTNVELRSIGELCVCKSIVILSDEVYSRIAFTPNIPRIAAESPAVAAHTLTVGSVGKFFDATGWRLGYVIGPSALVSPVQAAHILLCYTTAGPAQKASVEALKEAESTGWWDQNRREVREKLDSFCEVLNELELPVSLAYVSSLSSGKCLAAQRAYLCWKGLTSDHSTIVRLSGRGLLRLRAYGQIFLPPDFVFPADVANRTRDFKLCWYLV